MFSAIHSYCDTLVKEFDQIPEARRELLVGISDYIEKKCNQNKNVHLVYICTHNSRRSHFGQIWAALAGNYYQINNVYTYSGGTEATAFHGNAIQALKRIGFKVHTSDQKKNPVWLVYFDEHQPPLKCFSKVYDHPDNPKSEFAAIMTCSDAEQNCPFIPGAELRVATTYDDPKLFDHTPQQNEKYDERCRQIAREILFVFSKVKRR